MTEHETGPGGAEFEEAGRAEAEEAAAAAEEILEAPGEEVFEEDAPASDEDAMAAAFAAVMEEARQDGIRARARWTLVHKELLLLLLANCLFFTGAIVAWARRIPWLGPSVDYATGLSTIRGAMILALAIYGFWIMYVNLKYRQLYVWPFLINAILGLWVGLQGILRVFDNGAWKAAGEHLEDVKAQGESVNLLDRILTPLSTIAPGFWLLTLGAIVVLLVLLKGILGGASQARAASAASGGRRRRR